MSETRPRRVLVTATPPTPNGDLHIGHLSGPYLGADACTRYLRLRGIDAAFITGIDEHQSYVALKAHQVGRETAETASHFGELMASTWAAARIEPDHVAWPRRSVRHTHLVQEFCRSLFDRGVIVPRTTQTLECTTCRRGLFEAWVHGGCPHCGEPSGGNACEVCGRPNDCADLIEPRCTVCGSQPTTRTSTRLYFEMSKFEPQLRAYTARVSMSAHLRSMCDRMFQAGLPDICVSHLTDWGVPVPVPGFEEQRLYVWFEMAPGYLAATADLPQSDGAQGWRPYWADADAEVVQFFGFDNGYFHALLFPALMMAYSPSIRLPTTFVVNEFYQLDHQKISTSRNHAIWGAEFVPEVTADVARYYLAFTAPEREQTTFTREEFRRVVQAELHESLATWLSELARLRHQCNVRHAPPPPTTWSDEQRSFLARLRMLEQACAEVYEPRSFSLQRAARQVSEIARLARQFGRSHAFLIGVPERSEELQNSIALSLLAAKLVALAAWPLMPSFAERLWSELGYPAGLATARWSIPAEWVSPHNVVAFEERGYFPMTPSVTAATVERSSRHG